MKLRVTIDGREHLVELDGDASAIVDGKEVKLTVQGDRGSGQEVIAADASRRLTVSTQSALSPGARGGMRLLAGGRVVEAKVETERDRLRALTRTASSKSGPISARSTLPGVIRRVFKKKGDPVEEGEPILTLEAMKMENEVRAEAKGKVSAVFVREGQVVNAGDALAEIEAS